MMIDEMMRWVVEGFWGWDDPDMILSKIWRQFPHDVMAQAANKACRRLTGATVLLDVAERSNASHVNSRNKT